MQRQFQGGCDEMAVVKVEGVLLLEGECHVEKSGENDQFTPQRKMGLEYVALIGPRKESQPHIKKIPLPRRLVKIH